jgi:hypothetical protein
MIDRHLGPLLDWWAALPPEYAFLLGLPFFVAAVGLCGDAWQRRGRRRRAS